MFAEAATSETAGTSTDATMHAASTKLFWQAGVFDEADGASTSSGKGLTHHAGRLFVCVSFSSRFEFRLPRNKTSLVSGFQPGFEFRISEFRFRN